jgi:uncharacterized protein (DUF1778 family)
MCNLRFEGDVDMTISSAAAAMAKQVLARQQAAWFALGRVDLPKDATRQDYDALVDAVEEAARNNESLSALTARIAALGAGVATLAKKLEVL